MKIDIRHIVTDHFRTLYDARTGNFSRLDLVLFYVMPLTAAVAAKLQGFAISNDAYNVSITFFGIFIALLLNIQVALFSILQRKWDRPADPRIAEIQEETLSDRARLLKELNSNISYLILTSCIALFMALLFYVKDWKAGYAPSMMVFLYSHFLLVLVMIVKRAHALFQREYTDSQ